MGSIRPYKIQNFAKLAGVTVKTLHHYDRLGLLTARRTPSGYRVYLESDLERLEQIVALKYLGLPLRQIQKILNRGSLALPDVLRAQRLALEERRQILERALKAIQAAEASLLPGEPADPGVLKTMIEVFHMQEAIGAMRKYYSEAGWKQHRQYYEEGPSPEWIAFYRDAAGLLATDPAGPEAQALADRWLALSVQAWQGDTQQQTDSPAAWADRENWPGTIKQRAAEYKREQIEAFLQHVVLHARRKYFSESSWSRYLALRQRAAAADPVETSRVWQAHVKLFRDAARAGRDHLTNRSAREFARRWKAILEAESGGDAEVASSLMAVWADRAGWPATLRWRMEALSTLAGPEFDLAADCLLGAWNAHNRPAIGHR